MVEEAQDLLKAEIDQEANAISHGFTGGWPESKTCILGYQPQEVIILNLFKYVLANIYI